MPGHGHGHRFKVFNIQARSDNHLAPLPAIAGTSTAHKRDQQERQNTVHRMADMHRPGESQEGERVEKYRIRPLSLILLCEVPTNLARFEVQTFQAFKRETPVPNA